MTDSPGRPFGEPDGAPQSSRTGWSGPNAPGAYGPPPQPYYPGFMPPPTGHRNGLGTGSLVLALVALVATVTIFGGAILGIAAVAMGLVARGRVRRGEATDGGIAVAAIALGIVAAVVGLSIIWLAFGTELFNETYQHCLGERNGHAEYCQQYR
ncbi:MAG TPA: DUF4190 domain-containing protein [Mycobacterium sp.]|jgi:hypothetical protein|uniref:DUF4190 domain-containing protein n=1 Tax=Mycobacterium sp. TaxID=1785 RepID=UPI002D0C5A70|nr:DUF4190 domain-containing protein [Mycobacterium sp.]HXO79053.1 DUF4190 domain-containing protein [Mycobacterium sp.]